jgi:hypothetical protein
MDIVIVVVVLLAIPAGIYGLHRLGLYLERRGLVHYWHSKPSGGAGYNPFQEMVQPQKRHVIQVEEQQVREDGEGGPPEPNCTGEAEPRDRFVPGGPWDGEKPSP